MRRFHRLVSVLAALALLLAVPGLAGADFPDVSGTRFEDSANYLKSLGVIVGNPNGTYAPGRNITRAEASKIIVNSIGRGDQVAAHADGAAFTDTAGHWANGYIALAQNLGIVDGFPDGTFQPDNYVTYVQMAKMLLEAGGHGPAPDLSWPENYMSAAADQGLFTGIVAYLPDVPAGRGDCGMMTAYLIRNVANRASGQTLAQSVFGTIAGLALTPDSSSTPAGAAVQLTATPQDAAGATVNGLPVGFTTNDPANVTISQTGLFNSAVPGVYTVTATSGGFSVDAVVTVFGAPVALRALPSTTHLGATGSTMATVTVEVVDAVGNRVTNNDSVEVTMDYAEDGDNGAVTLGEATQTVGDGVAVFEVTSTIEGGRTDTLHFTGAGLTPASISLSTVDQVATSIAVTAAPDQVMANNVNMTEVTAVVLDQAGQPLAVGVLTELTFAVSGPGTFAGGSTAPEPVITTTGEATVEVYSVQAEPGTITITATAEGLSPGEVEVLSYVATAPVGLAAVVDDNTITAAEIGADADVATLRVGLVDAGGNPANRGANTLLDVTLTDGEALDTVGLVLVGEATIFAGSTRTTELTLRSVDGASGLAGEHMLTVTDGEWSADFTVTVVPGAPAALDVTPATDVTLPIGDSADLTVQLADAAGNEVAVAGREVTVGWQDPGVANRGQPVLDGVVSPPADPAGEGAVTAVTDAAGQARFRFAPQGYTGDDYRLLFRSDALSASSGTFTVVDQVASDLELVFRDSTGAAISRLNANYGDFATLSVTVKDGAGNPQGGWDVEVTFPDGGANVQGIRVDWGTVIGVYTDGVITLRTHDDPGDPRHGSVGLSLAGAAAGAFEVEAKALGLAVPVINTAPFRILPGTVVAGVKVTNPAGDPATGLEVPADDPIELRLVPTDHGGNQIISPVDVKVVVDPIEGLYSTGTSGEFRLQPTGTGVPTGGHVTIPRNTDELAIFYVQALAQGNVNVGLDGTDTAYVAYDIDLVATQPLLGPPPVHQLTFQVTDGSGDPVSGIAVSLTETAGSLDKTAGTTDADGQITVIWTDGGGGSLKATVDNAVRGGGVNLVETIQIWPGSN